MMRSRLSLLLVALALAAGPFRHAVSAEFRDFDAKTLARIRADSGGKPLVVAFWSIYCEPCREEMAQWGELARKHPGASFVLVATDPPDDRPKLDKLLSRYDLSGVQTWAYADDFEERVRYGVDPTWAGELPRTYLFDGDKRVDARSGVADSAWIDGWLAQRGGQPAKRRQSKRSRASRSPAARIVSSRFAKQKRMT